MKQSRLNLLFPAALAVAVLPWLIAAQGDTATKPQDPTKITGKTLIAAADMRWTPMPGLDGAMQVVLVGDPAKSAHRILYKWPAGTKAPLHTHSFGDRGVIISGSLSLAIDGVSPKVLPPGSYFSMAAGTKHITAVEGDAPCVFYLEREGVFDVNPVEAGGPAPKKQ